MKKLILLGSLLLAFSAVQAQVWLNQGQSGATLRTGIHENSGGYGYQVDLQYAFKGRLDLGVGFLQSFHPTDRLPANETPLGDLTEYGGTLWVEYWLIRSQSASGVEANAGLWLGTYQFAYRDYLLKNTLTGVLRKTTANSEYALGADFSLVYPLNSKWSLQPYIWFAYLLGVESYQLNTSDQQDSYHGSEGSVGVVLKKTFKRGQSGFVQLEQCLNDTKAEQAATFTLRIGYSLPGRE